MADEKIPTIDLESDESEQSDMDILNSTDDKVDDKVDDKEGKEDEIIDTEKEELSTEEVDEIEKDEKEELPETKLRPSIKTMVSEFPELEKAFKKYPQLRDAYFREGKFSQVYSSLEDAVEASEKASALDEITDLIYSGSSEELLEGIGKDTPEGLKKFVSNFLPTLSKMNNDLFYEATIPVVNNVIRNLYASGAKNKDNNLMSAAKIMANFLHGSYDIPESETKVDPGIAAERKKLDDEKSKLETEKYNEFDDSLNDRSRKLMTKVITEGLDPNNSLSDFTRSKIIDEVIERVGKELSSDKQHMTNITKLWKLARTERFSNKSADRILTAFLSRAKQLIPEIRSKVKNEAIGKNRTASTSSRSTTRENTTGTSRTNGNSKMPTDPKKVDKSFWRKNSDADILKG